MDRTGIGLLLILTIIVMGLFWLGGQDQIGITAARARMETNLQREPRAVQGVADIGMTLASKVVVGMAATLILTVGVMMYQRARIQELKQGGWERFWQRRTVRRAKTQKPASMQDVIMMLLARDLSQRK